MAKGTSLEIRVGLIWNHTLKVIIMSLNLPTRKVEYTTNFAAWTDITDYTIEFHLKRQDLSLGLWEFTLILDDSEGYFSNGGLPAIDTEQGLHDGFRFYVNDDIRMIGRAIGIESEGSSLTGDVFKVYGFGLGQEAMNLQAYSYNYMASKGDYIIGSQFTQLTPSDISYTSPNTATITYMPIPDTGIPSLYDIIVEVGDLINYCATFDSTQKAAPLGFFAKNTAAKQLGITLQSIQDSQTNNIISYRQSRSLIGCYNYVTLEQYEGHDISFTTEIPNLMDTADIFSIGDAHWTEQINGLYNPMWYKTSGTAVVLDDTDPYEGDYCIKCDGTYTAPPDFYINLLYTPYMTDLNLNTENIDSLAFHHKETTCIGVAVDPELSLEDDEGNIIYDEFSFSASWAQHSEAGTLVSPWGGFSGDTGSFTGIIRKIHFSDEADHSSYSGDDPDMFVDRLYFWEDGGNDTVFLQDATLVAAYGKRELRLPLPTPFPYINTYRWGLQVLNSLEQPMRIVEITTALDPALTMEDDDSTPADWLPGWSLELDIPRQKLNTLANGGKWWRILSSHEHWTPAGYTVDFTLTPTTSESPDDYSQTSGIKILRNLDPNLGRIKALARKQKFLTHKSYERYG